MCHQKPKLLLSVAQWRYVQLLQVFAENTLANSVTVSDIQCWVLAGAKAAAKSSKSKKGKGED